MYTKDLCCAAAFHNCGGCNHTENAREGLINEILYADDLVSMNESMENLREKFLTWKGAFEIKKLKVNLKTIVKVSG